MTKAARPAPANWITQLSTPVFCAPIHAARISIGAKPLGCGLETGFIGSSGSDPSPRPSWSSRSGANMRFADFAAILLGLLALDWLTLCKVERLGVTQASKWLCCYFAAICSAQLALIG